ncbi:HAD hydrolase family protein, partial [Citrobacter braakii]
EKRRTLLQACDLIGCAPEQAIAMGDGANDLEMMATAGLSAPAIAAPIRHVLRKQIADGQLTVLMGEVTGVDTASSCVQMDGGEHLHYDHLIVAAGATHSYFGR